MITANSIVFLLDKELKLYCIKDVNGLNLSAIEEITPAEKGLFLSDMFNGFWQKHWPEYLSKAETFYFLVGSRAGFTNSRVIFIWLQNMLSFFPEKQLKIFKLSQKETETFDSNWLLIVNKALVEGVSQLVYSKDPRIG